MVVSPIIKWIIVAWEAQLYCGYVVLSDPCNLFLWLYVEEYYYSRQTKTCFELSVLVKFNIYPLGNRQVLKEVHRWFD